MKLVLDKILNSLSPVVWKISKQAQRRPRAIAAITGRARGRTRRRVELPGCGREFVQIQRESGVGIPGPECKTSSWPG